MMASRKPKLSDQEERVEYQLSPDYIPHWTPVEMLREIIANALDTHSHYTIVFSPLLEKNMGQVCVTDRGPGFKKRFLMLGGGEAKTSAEIGQFKEGLKLAMLVAARNKLPFRLETTEFTITRVAIEPTQLGGDGLVVYLAPPEGIPGTRIVTRSTQKQYDRAVQLFACAEAEGSTIKRAPIPDPNKSHVWFDAVAGEDRQAIYVNGVYVQTVPTLFSYNLTGLDVKQAQNRDRNVISWYDVAGDAVDLVLATNDTRIMDRVTEAMLQPQGSGNNREYPDLQFGWRKVILHPELWQKSIERSARKLNLLNPNSSVVKICTANPGCDEEYAIVAKEAGWTVLSFRGQSHMFSGMYESVRQAGKQSASDRVLEPVAVKDQTDTETRNIQILQTLLEPFFREEGGLKPIRIFTICYDNDRAHGLWYRGMVWLKREYIAQPITAVNVQDRLNTVIHEMSHMKSDAGDRTRDFEHAMGMFAAKLVMNSPENVKHIAALKCDSNAWRAEVEAIPAVTFAEIMAQYKFTLNDAMKTPRKKLETLPEGWRPVTFYYGTLNPWSKSKLARTRCYHNKTEKGRDVLLTIELRKDGSVKHVSADYIRFGSAAWTTPTIKPYVPEPVAEPQPKARRRAAAQTKEMHFNMVPCNEVYADGALRL